MRFLACYIIPLSNPKVNIDTIHNTRDTIMVYDRDTLEPLHGLTP